MALGVMQMTLSDYSDITLAQFFNKAEGFYAHLAAMQEMEWMRTNYLVFAMISQNPYIEQKAKPKSFEAFLEKQKKK